MLDWGMKSFTTIPSHPTSVFLSLEGVEGAGKSTQGMKLCQYLKSLGKEVTLLREPGGTVFGEELRKTILQCQKPLDPLAEAYLFASSRSQLMQEKILPLLKLPHQVVVVDRYYDSSVAYQGFARKLGPNIIENIHSNPPLSYMPHLSFYLKISMDLSLARMESREKPKDYFESQGQSFLATIISGFDWCAKHYPERVVTITGDGNVEQVSQHIQQVLDEKLKDIP